MVTVYPAQIDNNSTLPVVTDNLTPVTGSVYNRLQEAVIRIEQELGVKPSGLYSTVKARLDALERIIAKLNLNLQFGGDLAAQDDPTIQHVVGIHGNTILYQPTISVGSSLRFNGTNWVQTNLYQDDILPPFYISITGPSMMEVNQTLIEPVFYATYNFEPPTSIYLTDSDGYSKTIDIVDRHEFNSDHTFQKLIFGDYVTFTLTATHHEVTKSVTHNVFWGQKTYWGVGPTGYTSAADIDGYLSGHITNVLASSFTLTAGIIEKIYFACRTAYGVPILSIDGVDGGFTLISNSIALTNDYGFLENYSLYESNDSNLGTTTITVR
jgi:hypothetical protein